MLVCNHVDGGEYPNLTKTTQTLINRRDTIVVHQYYLNATYNRVFVPINIQHEMV